MHRVSKAPPTHLPTNLRKKSGNGGRLRKRESVALSRTFEAAQGAMAVSTDLQVYTPCSIKNGSLYQVRSWCARGTLLVRSRYAPKALQVRSSFGRCGPVRYGASIVGERERANLVVHLAAIFLYIGIYMGIYIYIYNGRCTYRNSNLTTTRA